MMLVRARHQKIVEIVNQRGSVRNHELSALFNVTEETIRRDLYKLEKEGRLLRSHGGAVSIKEADKDIPFAIREITNVEEKKLIALEAVQHIKPHDRIVLDASSTAWYMAKLVPDIPITVITNSVKVIVELNSKEKMQVIATGGMLANRSMSFVGPLAERSLVKYHVDKAFISSKGAYIDSGISESNELQAMIKQKMISIADETYILCDHTKFEVQHLTKVADWSEIDHVITVDKVGSGVVDGLRRKNVNVIIAVGNGAAESAAPTHHV